MDKLQADSTERNQKFVRFKIHYFGKALKNIHVF